MNGCLMAAIRFSSSASSGGENFWFIKYMVFHYKNATGNWRAALMQIINYIKHVKIFTNFLADVAYNV